MGNGDDVKVGDAARPEIGRDYVFAEVELRTGPQTGPPASMSRVWRCGVTSRMESPSPTSMEVTSKIPARVCGSGGTKARVKDAVSSASRPMTASRARRRARIMAQDQGRGCCGDHHERRRGDAEIGQAQAAQAMHGASDRLQGESGEQCGNLRQAPEKCSLARR